MPVQYIHKVAITVYTLVGCMASNLTEQDHHHHHLLLHHLLHLHHLHHLSSLSRHPKVEASWKEPDPKPRLKNSGNAKIITSLTRYQHTSTYINIQYINIIQYHFQHQLHQQSPGHRWLLSALPHRFLRPGPAAVPQRRQRRHPRGARRRTFHAVVALLGQGPGPARLTKTTFHAMRKRFAKLEAEAVWFDDFDVWFVCCFVDLDLVG